MKALKLVILGMVLFFASTMQAQVSVNVNIGSPPPWGPYGYADVRYYYLPDVEAYYDVQSSMFIYFGGGAWIHRAYLPSRYRNYDLYGGYKVVMNDYRGNTPYTHFNEHKIKYGKGYRGPSQKTIGQRPGRGNSKTNNFSNGNSNKKVNPGNNKAIYRGNNNNMNSNRSNGSGNNKNAGNGNSSSKNNLSNGGRNNLNAGNGNNNSKNNHGNSGGKGKK